MDVTEKVGLSDQMWSGDATIMDVNRVFSSDISECTACGGRLRIIAALTDPASI